MKIKTGVKLQGLIPQMVLGASVAESACKSVLGWDYVMTITSALDGKHKRASAHYTGRAIDIRTRDMDGKEHVVGEALKEYLGEQFDAVVEHDHIHIEYDPKEPV